MATGKFRIYSLFIIQGVVPENIHPPPPPPTPPRKVNGNSEVVLGGGGGANTVHEEISEGLGGVHMNHFSTG